VQFLNLADQARWCKCARATDSGRCMQGGKKTITKCTELGHCSELIASYLYDTMIDGLFYSAMRAHIQKGLSVLIVSMWPAPLYFGSFARVMQEIITCWL